MDYLREVERRQRAVLIRLLTGEHSREETAAEEERRIPERSGMEAGRRENLRPAGGRSDYGAERAAAAPVPAPVQDTETLPADGLELSGQAALFRQTRSADALWRAAAESPAGVSWVLPAAGRAAETEDISRAVQRDARRYDGGFTMF